MIYLFKLVLPCSGSDIVYVFDHQGPHPDEYHKYVEDELTLATQGLQAGTKAYKDAAIKTLEAIGKEAQTPGTRVNWLITK
ncbi:MAG: AHH domain-containing protein [Bacteroidetes bacterium]|nr:AHH domain-containing protein [Bacteroidota bacterium]